MQIRPINGDAFRSLCDHVFWHNAEPEENTQFENGRVVFCKIDEVWRLFRALRRTTKRIVLVTGEGDKPVTEDLWAQKPPHVMSWFGTNMFADHPTAHPIPLGLGNADGKVTLSWEEIQQPVLDRPLRDHLLYANFGSVSNPAVREPLLQWIHRPDQSWITKETHSSVQGKAGYLNQLRTHRFVFCPPGNGEDTHRMWEALYCGAIPVVRISPAMRAFRDLPIVFVKDLTAISPQSLEERFKELGSRSIEKLDLPSWKQSIDRERISLSKKGPVTLAEAAQAWFSEILRMMKNRS